jgi:hypothetical protein
MSQMSQKWWRPSKPPNRPPAPTNTKSGHTERFSAPGAGSCYSNQESSDGIATPPSPEPEPEKDSGVRTTTTADLIDALRQMGQHDLADKVFKTALEVKD